MDKLTDPLILLVIVSLAHLVLALNLLRILDYSEDLVFDVTRGTLITGLGWLVVGFSAFIDPLLMGSPISAESHMAVSTLFCFIFAALGNASFLWFRTKAHYGQSHPRRFPV